MTMLTPVLGYPTGVIPILHELVVFLRNFDRVGGINIEGLDIGGVQDVDAFDGVTINRTSVPL